MLAGKVISSTRITLYCFHPSISQLFIPAIDYIVYTHNVAYLLYLKYIEFIIPVLQPIHYTHIGLECLYPDVENKLIGMSI